MEDGIDRRTFCPLGKRMIDVGKSKFKYVRIREYMGRNYYEAGIARYQWSRCFYDERVAAVAVDRKLLEKGCDAVNVLVKLKK